jgi:spermidine/putrescine transport system ATP-binding protein
MTQAAIELHQVTKRFAEFEAVKQLNLTIGKGEFFSIVGPSGCGKTTTLKMIAGFEYPTEGSIILSGQEVKHLPPYKRNVNTVFQNYALFPHMNVFQNVAYPLKIAKVAKNEIIKRVAQSLEMVSMTPFIDRSINQLSGGQRQRIALARALIHKPEVLLLDEPLSALDFHLRQDMQRMLKQIQREVKITFIYITHDQGEALSLSDRIAVMEKGILHQVGTPEEIYETPKTKFVAGFIGKTNLLAGRMASAHEFVSDRGLRIQTLDNIHVIKEENLYISIRPEKLRLRAENDHYINRVKAICIEETYYGAEKEITLELVGGIQMLLRQTKDGSDQVLSPGQEIELYFRPEDAVVVKEQEG